MVFMVDPEDNVVDAPDVLYYYMIDRGYTPYLGSTPVPVDDPEGPNDGDVARFHEGTRKFLPMPVSGLAAEVAAHPALTATFVSAVAVDDEVTFYQNGVEL